MPFAQGRSRLRSVAAAAIPTGLQCVDEVAGGLGAGELWLAYGDRVTVPALLNQLASLVAGLGYPVSMLSMERPSVDLWRLLISGWTGIRPQRVGRTDLESSERLRMQWSESVVNRLRLTVAGCELEWGLETAADPRLVVLDGVKFDEGDDGGITPASVRSFARVNDITVLVGIYDADDVPRWARYADASIRLGAPIGGKRIRAGECDLRVSSIKYLLRTKTAVNFRPRGWRCFADLDPPQWNACDATVLSRHRRDAATGTQ